MPTVSEIKGCEGCPLRDSHPLNRFVTPVQGVIPRVAVGEFPQEADQECGKPFSGGDGKWLAVMYRNVGVKVEEISRLNILQCRPPNDEWPKDPSIARHCYKAHVEPFIKEGQFKRVDLFGEQALRHLAGKSGIDTWRGSPLPVDCLGADLRTVPTFHPQRLQEDQSMVPVAIEDLRKPLTRDAEHYNLYPSIGVVQSFMATTFAFDIESNRWDNTQIYMVGLSAANGESIAVPWQEPYITELRRIFHNAEQVIGQNLVQFDLPMLAHHGVVIRGPKECMVWDLMLMHHLRFPSFPHDLEFIGKQFTNKGAWKHDKASFETYCARDTDVTFRCFSPLFALLRESDLLDIYQYVSWPLALICKRMKDRGFQRSTSRVQELREKYLNAIEAAQAELPEPIRTHFITKRRRLAAPEGTVNAKGKPLKYVHEEYQEAVHPWKSSAVKMDYLYNVLGLPVQKHLVSGQPTADKGALDRLYNRLMNPSKEFLRGFGAQQGSTEYSLEFLRKQVRLIKDLSAMATRLSGFAKESVADDVIHPSFNVHGTETGRFSSSNPNAQNIPEEARFMYVPRNPGGRIIAMDYSGIENRATAYLAQDKQRQKRFEDPEFSEHKFLAANLEGIPYENVVKSKDRDSWYAIAKAAVHGSDRMMGAKKMWEKNDLDPDLVKTALATWKELISGTVRWQKRVTDDTKRRGWACNPFGRRLWFWESNAATRIVSFYPQSTAFDVIARAMIGLMYEKIGWPEEWARKVTPVLRPLPDEADLNFQVHDELVVETETEEAVAPTIDAMKEVMQQPWPELNNLSFPVGIGVGLSWGECG
jgi:uracil-DNA glycosylase family 4